MRLLLLLILLPMAASGHDLGMNRVELREIDDQQLVLDAWFDPERIHLATPPGPPVNWTLSTGPEILPDHPKQIVRYRFTRLSPDPPDGALLLPWKRQALAIRLLNREGTFSSQLLRQPEGPFRIELAQLRDPAPTPIGPAFIATGMEHILFGWDHLLFILCFTLLLGCTWKLPAALTGFTLSHTLSLALGATGIVSLPAQIVEPLIALSITALSCEIVRQHHQEQPGLTSRYPALFAVAFGLLHGFGFAGAFGELHIPAGEILSTLLWFTVGIEFGQVLIVGGALALGSTLQAILRTTTLAPMPRYAACAAGLLSATWFWSRLPFG